MARPLPGLPITPIFILWFYPFHPRKSASNNYELNASTSRFAGQAVPGYNLFPPISKSTFYFFIVADIRSKFENIFLQICLI